MTVAAKARRTVSTVLELAVATLRTDSDPYWSTHKAFLADYFIVKAAINGHPYFLNV